MVAASVTLSGSALVGVVPGAITGTRVPAPRALPARVRLGKMPPKSASPNLKLNTFWDQSKLRAYLPAKTSWRTLAAKSIGAMLGNDRWGDCVWASKMHTVGLVTANQPLIGPEAVGTDAEAVKQYHAVCGPGDNGCVIQDVLDFWLRHGIQVGGKQHNLSGYVAFDWTDAEITKACVALLLGACIGIQLPADWTRNAVWDVTDSPIVGGHDVALVDYDDTGVYVASWSRVYRITWRAFTSRSWLDEGWAMLSPDLAAGEILAPSGLKVEELSRALSAIGQGHVPDGPTPPVPPDPPVPPKPPVPVDGAWVANLTFRPDYARTGWAVMGTVTPSPSPGINPDTDTATVECQTAPVAANVAELVARIAGVAATRRGTSVVVSRVGLSPEQWQAIVRAILEIVAVVIGAGR